MDLGELIPVITGSGGAIVVAMLWVRYLIKRQQQLIDAHQEKDHELMALTRECLRCIDSSITHSENEKTFRSRLEHLMQRIEKRLDQSI